MRARDLYDRASQTHGLDFSPRAEKRRVKLYASCRVLYAVAIILCFFVLGLLLFVAVAK